jgi:hypothetical protein
MGCDDSDPGRRGGPACNLGFPRNAKVVGKRIMPAPDHPLHCGSLICMKRGSIRLAPPLVQKEKPPLGHCFQMQGDLAQADLPAGFQQIADFSEQFLFSRRAGRRRNRRRLLEAVHLFDDEEKAKSNNQKFND